MLLTSEPLECLFNRSKRTWPPGSPNSPQSLPVTAPNYPTQGLGCPSLSPGSFLYNLDILVTDTHTFLPLTHTPLSFTLSAAAPGFPLFSPLPPPPYTAQLSLVTLDSPSCPCLWLYSTFYSKLSPPPLLGTGMPVPFHFLFPRSAGLHNYTIPTNTVFPSTQ